MWMAGTEQLMVEHYFVDEAGDLTLFNRTMQLAARKTAIAFHAKDDLPEMRREVFALLRAPWMSRSSQRFAVKTDSQQRPQPSMRLRARSSPRMRSTIDW
jgi:hypothetical protein